MFFIMGSYLGFLSREFAHMKTSLHIDSTITYHMAITILDICVNHLTNVKC